MRTVGLEGNSPTLFKKSSGKKNCFHRAWKITFLYVSTNIQDRTFLWRTNTFIAILSVEENQTCIKVVMSNGHLKRYYFEKCQVTSCVITTLMFHSGRSITVCGVDTVRSRSAKRDEQALKHLHKHFQFDVDFHLSPV